MTTFVENLRPVITQPEREFGAILAKVLSPARPLQSEEFLRGRAAQLQGIERALYAPGRHVLIHGMRGVGKSSLAQTAAFKLAEGPDPILVSCDRKSTFGSIIKDLFDEVTRKDPRITEKVREVGGSGGVSWLNFGLSADVSVATVEGEIPEPVSVNDAVRVVQFLCESYAERPVFVVDEFDLVESKDVQGDFANLVKQVSDKHVEARFIFCGIGDSADALMEAHASADRYFHAVELDQLPWESRFEIVEDSARKLGIKIDRDTVIRIARISDGFPHYVHFITEKLFWRVFEAKNGGVVTPELFELAMEDAAGAMDMKLRGPYEQATQKYGDDYEAILWAVADGHEMKKRSADIYDSYQRIMRGLDDAALERAKFNQRINRLKQEAHACILSGSRAGWYEFTEKMIRGYVRLKAEQNDVELAADHPLRRTR